MAQAIHTSKAPAPGGAFSQAVVSGDLIFTAGQIGADPATGELAKTLEDQIERALDNLEEVLKEAGSGLHEVVKTTCFLADISDFSVFNAVYAKRFAQPYPGRSTFGVGLAGDIRFEIEAVAIRASAE